MGKGQDHYVVLGVSRDAPDEVIRAAYRALAAKYHPDRNPGDRDAELKLKRLNAAHRVLGDPQTKRQYDELTCGPDDEATASEPSREDEEQPLDEGRPRDRRTAHPGSIGKPRSALRSVLRGIGILAGLCVVGLVAVILWAEHKDAKYRADQASVIVRVVYDSTACRNQVDPIQISISNSSESRTVKRVTFDLEAYEEGRSDDLVVSGHWQESTRVVRPGVTKITCWTVPSFKRAVSNEVLFRAKKDSVDFYEEGDVIPPDPARSSAL